ncbi:protein CutA isoform 2-T2 [Porphyrio hochstetteri]
MAPRPIAPCLSVPGCPPVPGASACPGASPVPGTPSSHGLCPPSSAGRAAARGRARRWMLGPGAAGQSPLPEEAAGTPRCPTGSGQAGGHRPAASRGGRGGGGGVSAGCGQPPRAAFPARGRAGGGTAGDGVAEPALPAASRCPGLPPAGPRHRAAGRQRVLSPVFPGEVDTPGPGHTARGRLQDVSSAGKVLTLSLLMYPVLRSLALQLHSAVTGSYISGTHSIAFINCLNEQIAKDIARYFWKGELEESTEILLLVKTRTSKIGELSDYVRSIHPFEIPEIISLPIDQGNPLYLKWIEESVPRN